MFCPHLACQAAFYDVQSVWCKHDHPLKHLSYPRDLRPGACASRSEGLESQCRAAFWSAHIAEGRRSPPGVIREVRVKGAKTLPRRAASATFGIPDSTPDTV